MSWQAVSWAMYRAPMLLTEKLKPDTTARHVLNVLAEAADEHGKSARPSVLRIGHATGFDDRTVSRALLRLERGNLIKRAGVSRNGVVEWELAVSVERPESDWIELQAEADRNREEESARRRERREKAKTPDVSGTQDAGHDPVADNPEGDLVRHLESRTPGFKMPDAGILNPGVRDGTPPEPLRNHPGPVSEPPLGGTLPPKPPCEPLDPPASDPGNEHTNSARDRDQLRPDVIGELRPRARGETGPEPARPDRTGDDVVECWPACDGGGWIRGQGSLARCPGSTHTRRLAVVPPPPEPARHRPAFASGA